MDEILVNEMATLIYGTFRDNLCDPSAAQKCKTTLVIGTRFSAVRQWTQQMRQPGVGHCQGLRGVPFRNQKRNATGCRCTVRLMRANTFCQPDPSIANTKPPQRVLFLVPRHCLFFSYPLHTTGEPCVDRRPQRNSRPVPSSPPRSPSPRPPEEITPRGSSLSFPTSQGCARNERGRGNYPIGFW